MYISKYLMDYQLAVEGYTSQELIAKIYQEMSEFSFLTPYLYSRNVEEININSWEDIKINLSNGEEITSDEKFSSPTHALDVIRRLLQTSGMILDYSNPILSVIPNDRRIYTIENNVREFTLIKRDDKGNHRRFSKD